MPRCLLTEPVGRSQNFEIVFLVIVKVIVKLSRLVYDGAVLRSGDSMTQSAS